MTIQFDLDAALACVSRPDFGPNQPIKCFSVDIAETLRPAALDQPARAEIASLWLNALWAAGAAWGRDDGRRSGRRGGLLDLWVDFLRPDHAVGSAQFVAQRAGLFGE